ncbi:MAG TPA: hypothetical protein VHB50_00765 [Bryobacteraceae bacterium]|nr:hypothetical protein [Bryobacteraceae bacterium]
MGLFAATAGAQDNRPNFSGSWQLNSAKSEVHSGKPAAIKLTIEQKGSTIHVVRTLKATDGKETSIEFNCTTDGKDCDAKGAKVSLWYDGSSLVEMDIGETVTKSKMTLSGDGKTLSYEITFISPQADADNLELDKI